MFALTKLLSFKQLVTYSKQFYTFTFTFRFPLVSVTHLAWYNEDDAFVVAYSDGLIQMCGRKANDVPHVLLTCTHPASALLWSPGGQYLAAAGSNESEVHVWRFDGGGVVGERCVVECKQPVTILEWYNNCDILAWWVTNNTFHLNKICLNYISCTRQIYNANLTKCRN